MRYRLDTGARLFHTKAVLEALDIRQISILDLGSRDGRAMEDIQKRGDYKRLIATDIHHRIESGIEFIAHDLETKLPFKDDEFDVVICTDVLEHVERKNQLASEIRRVSRKHVLISLPNTQHHKYVRGLKRGNMGKQYVFDVEDCSDRHRWVTFYKDNISFVSKYFLIEEQIDICDRSRDTIFARVKPSAFVRNQFMSCHIRK